MLKKTFKEKELNWKGRVWLKKEEIAWKRRVLVKDQELDWKRRFAFTRMVRFKRKWFLWIWKEGPVLKETSLTKQRGIELSNIQQPDFVSNKRVYWRRRVFEMEKNTLNRHCLERTTSKQYGWKGWIANMHIYIHRRTFFEGKGCIRKNVFVIQGRFFWKIIRKSRIKQGSRRKKSELYWKGRFFQKILTKRMGFVFVQ